VARHERATRERLEAASNEMARAQGRIAARRRRIGFAATHLQHNQAEARALNVEEQARTDDLAVLVRRLQHALIISRRRRAAAEAEAAALRAELRSGAARESAGLFPAPAGARVEALERQVARLRRRLRSEGVSVRSGGSRARQTPAGVDAGRAQGRASALGAGPHPRRRRRGARSERDREATVASHVEARLRTGLRRLDRARAENRARLLTGAPSPARAEASPGEP
jgi:hypothetical protein